MNCTISPHPYSGEIALPASKSHTIRRLLIAALAHGESRLVNPLDSLDARSCAAVCQSLGAKFNKRGAIWIVDGVRGAAGLSAPEAPLDVGNSGTTLFLALAVAALGGKPVTFTGDAQIERRSAAPLLDALGGLGVSVQSREGCTPVTVCGPLRGGRVSLACPTSQYLSALLLAAPLAPAGTVTEIDVPLLNERPYIEMTLSYLAAQHIAYQTNADFSYFRLEGGAAYHPVDGPVPGDFSSAAFPALAAAVSGGQVTLRSLDPADFQGDKIFFNILEEMGCNVAWRKDAEGWMVSVSRGSPLRAAAFDLNDTPDLLPACAVLAAFAEGETRLYNVAHARIKETDRIAVMAAELAKLGVTARELPDGLVIHGAKSWPPAKPILLDGHGDHRIVMSLACAGLALPGGVTITGAEAAAVTYPDFLATLNFP